MVPYSRGMQEDLIESGCNRHGVDRHVIVHEAGHAAAAIEHGIPFRAVVLYDHVSAPRFLGGLAYAPGAVDMGTDDATTWAQPDVVASLRFVCGGFAAEQAILDHAIDGGWYEDLKAWRIGIERRESLDGPALDAIVDGSFLAVVKEVQAWAAEQADRIKALADHLGNQTAPYEMPRDEVEAFLRDL